MTQYENTDPLRDWPRWIKFGLKAAQILALCAIAYGLYRSYRPSLLGNAVLVFLMASVGVVFITRMVAFFNGNLGLPNTARTAWQVTPRIVMYALMMWVCYLALIPVQIDETLRPVVMSTPIISGLMLIIASLFPRKYPNFPYLIFSVVVSAGLASAIIMAHHEPDTDTITVDFPFADEAYVVHGGASVLTNYHYIHKSQKHALDIIRTRPKGNLTRGEALTEDACFGAPLIAVANGVVRGVVRDLPDQKIGETDRKNPAGNSVIIEIAPDRYAMYAHLKQGSAVVAVGDRVKTGDIIGSCGNSGNTSHPHLHFQIQSKIDLFDSENQTVPVRFRNIEWQRGSTWRNSTWRTKGPVALRRNDRARPIVR